MTTFKYRNSNIFICLWLATLIITLIIQALTIDVLPSVQQDDALITDYGRLTLNPRSDWSVTWLVANNKPLLIWTYIGPLLAEISFQLGGNSGVGTRIMALIGGAFAASMSLGWLIKRNVPIYASYGIAVAFLLDPLFTYSQRMARVDSWVIGFCLAACWLLKTIPEKNHLHKKYYIALAGGLVTIASMIWPSAIFLYPLIAFEFLNLFQKKDWNNIGKKFSMSLLYFIGGAITTLILLIIPFWENIRILFGDMSTMVSQNVETATPFWHKLMAIFNLDLWLKAIKTYAKILAPFLPLLALAGAWHRREKGLIVVTVLTTILIFSTLVYEFRILYLYPYFLALGGGLFLNEKAAPLSVPMRIRKVGLIIVVSWAIGVSLFLRSALAFDKYPVNNRTRIEQAALSAIGPGDYKVFLAFTFELYYIGRSLGWKLYTPYVYFNYNTLGAWTRENEYEPKSEFLKLLSEMDYAIFHKSKITEDLRKQLLEAGLNYKSTIVVNEEYRYPVYSKSESRSTQVILWFLRGEPSYGPYEIFARKKANQHASTPHLGFQK